MMMQEFTERTGVTPTFQEYRDIEAEYYAFDGGKDAFGYDREKALARCAKRRAAEGREDVGEEALSALVRYGTENGKKNRRKA